MGRTPPPFSTEQGSNESKKPLGCFPQICLPNKLLVSGERVSALSVTNALRVAFVGIQFRVRRDALVDRSQYSRVVVRSTKRSDV